MFKPEYIQDNLELFGPYETVKLIQNKFMRMGKSRAIAYIMASKLVTASMRYPTMVD